jgi:hypothetical protein
MMYKKIQKIFARGIDYCLAKRFLTLINGGYRCRKSCSSFLPAGQGLFLLQKYVTKFKNDQKDGTGLVLVVNRSHEGATIL